MKRLAMLVAIVALTAFVALPQTASATLIAYDGFTGYTGNVAGETGGSGWSGAWVQETTDADCTMNAITTGLTYGALTTASGAGLTTTGVRGVKYNRPFDKGSYFDAGDTVWMSILIKRNDGEWDFGVEIQNTSIARPHYPGNGPGLICGNTDLSAMSRANGRDWVADAYTNGNVLFTVVRTTIHSGSTVTVDAWFDPDLSTDLSAVAIGSGDSSVGEWINGISSNPDGVLMLYSAKWDVHTFDEIRIATTMAEVMVPEPATMVLLAMGGVGMLLRRRR